MLEGLVQSYHRWAVKRRVRRHGWTAIYVGDYASGPSWTYTIGFLASLGEPEIIVFDLPQEVANQVLHEVYGDVEGGLVIRDGEAWRPGESPGRAVWRRVHPSRFVDEEEPWLGVALTFSLVTNPETPFEAFQLVLSDDDGRLPWEDGYDERLRHLQRPLWEPDELAADHGV